MHILKEVNVQFLLKCLMLVLLNNYNKYQLYIRHTCIFLTELLTEKFKHNSLQKKGKIEDIF